MQQEPAVPSPISTFFLKDLLHRKYVQHVQGQVTKLLP